MNNQKYLVFTPTGLLGQHLLITIERTREKDQGLSAQADAPASSLSACSAARLQFSLRGAGERRERQEGERERRERGRREEREERERRGGEKERRERIEKEGERKRGEGVDDMNCVSKFC